MKIEIKVYKLDSLEVNNKFYKDFIDYRFWL